jgi:hypothetical protein
LFDIINLMTEVMHPATDKASKAPQPNLVTPRNSDITPRHIADIACWQERVFPNGEPLPRQLNQFIQESGEVGEEVFGRSQDELNNLPQDSRCRIAAEVTDVAIAGLGTIKALGENYEKIREKKEKAVYDGTTVTKLERWQIDANGGEEPVDLRLSSFGNALLMAHRLYEKYRVDNIDQLTAKQRRRLSERVADAITKGLSVLNGIGQSFDSCFDEAYKIMNIKYNPERIQQLREQGLDDTEAMIEAKRLHSERSIPEPCPQTLEIVLFRPS